MQSVSYDPNCTVADVLNMAGGLPVAIERDGLPTIFVLSCDDDERLCELLDDFYLGQRVDEVRRRNDYISGPELIAEMKARLAEIEAAETAADAEAAKLKKRQSECTSLEELCEGYDFSNYKPEEFDWGEPVGAEIW